MVFPWEYEAWIEERAKELLEHDGWYIKILAKIKGTDPLEEAKHYIKTTIEVSDILWNLRNHQK